MIMDFVTKALNRGNAEIAAAPKMHNVAVMGIVL